MASEFLLPIDIGNSMGLTGLAGRYSNTTKTLQVLARQEGNAALQVFLNLSDPDLWCLRVPSAIIWAPGFKFWNCSKIDLRYTAS